jgi:hypothetical protein
VLGLGDRRLHAATRGTSTASLVNGQLSGCSSPDGSQTPLTSATITSSGLTATGCVPLFVSITGTVTFAWNNATTSTAFAAFSTNPFNPPILSVQVTTGTMAGDAATPIPLLIPHGLGCGLGGTSSLDVLIPAWLVTH